MPKINYLFSDQDNKLKVITSNISNEQNWMEVLPEKCDLEEKRKQQQQEQQQQEQQQQQHKKTPPKILKFDS